MNNIEYTDIMDLYSIERIPFSATIELNTRCNLRCEHCYIPDYNSDDLSCDALFKLLLDLRKLGTFELLFTGGEVFVRDDILEILKFSRSIGFNVKLFSNLTTLDEEMVKTLSKLSISLISTSIYSLDSEIHDSITKVKNSLNKTLESLSLLKKYGIKSEVKTIVMKKNYMSINKIREYCRNNGFNFVLSPFIFPKSSGDKSNTLFRLDNQSLINSIVDIVDDVNSFSPETKMNEDYICPSMRCSIGIESNGNVNPCNAMFYPIGNINEMSIIDIWERDDLKKVQNMKYSDLKGCENCCNQSFCIRCPGTALLEVGDYLQPFDFACKMAEARKNKYLRKEVLGL